MNHSTTRRQLITLLVFVSALACAPLIAQPAGPQPAPAVQTTPDPRLPTLDAAIRRLWLADDAAGARTELQGLASGPHDAVTARALFHLGCAELLTGHRDDARQRLAALERYTDIPGAASTARQLATMLNPEGAARAAASRTVSLDFRDTPIHDIIRLIAQKGDMPVIIDGRVPVRKVTVRLMDIPTEKALRLLANMADLRLETVEGILMVTSANRSNVTTRADGMIDVDFLEVDLIEALRLVAARAELNLVPHRKLDGRLTLRLQNVSPDGALQMLAKMFDLHMVRDGNCLVVMYRNDTATVMGKATHADWPLRYLDIKDAMAGLEEGGVTGVEAATSASSTVSLTGTPEMVAKGRDILRNIDKPQQAVMISAWIWELASGTTLDTEAFSRLTLDQKKAVAKLLTAPKVLTLPGREAEIKIGSEQPGGGESSIKLAMLPKRVADGLIQLSVKGSIKVFIIDSDGKKQQTREFNSTVVVAPDKLFAQDLKGQGSPMIIEYTLSNMK